MTFETGSGGRDMAPAQCVREILEFCTPRLRQHKVPAMIRIVPTLGVAAGGKLSRHGA